MKEIDKYMTISEASERWGIPENTVRAKLKNREKSYVEMANNMIEEGLIKFFVKKGGIRKEWIVSEYAMKKWFDKKE